MKKLFFASLLLSVAVISAQEINKIIYPKCPYWFSEGYAQYRESDSSYVPRAYTGAAYAIHGIFFKVGLSDTGVISYHPTGRTQNVRFEFLFTPDMAGQHFMLDADRFFVGTSTIDFDSVGYDLYLGTMKE
jgi:hypothetical protein